MTYSAYIEPFKPSNIHLLDTSDVILLSTEILFRIPFSDLDYETQRSNIVIAYLNQDYALALDLLKSTYTMLPEEYKKDLTEVLFQLSEGEIDRKDDSRKNESRRYFESKLVISAWRHEFLSERFSSLQKLASFMRNHNENCAYLPVEIANLEQAETVLKPIRDYVPDASSEFVIALRSHQKSLSGQKDRGRKKVDNALTMHQGIIKNTSPTPYDFHTSALRQNSIVDAFEINTEIENGFSVTNKYTPFVNSVSGTTYDLAALLLCYIEERKEDPVLQKDIDNIVLFFLLFTCKEGYHSLHEMLAVLTVDKIVDYLFKLHQISVGSNSLQPYLTTPFRDAAKNALVLASRKIVHRQLPNLQTEEDASNSGLSISSSSNSSFALRNFSLFSPEQLSTRTIEKITLIVQLRLEITVNASTKRPQPFFGALVKKIIPQDEAPIYFSEANGTSELLEFLKKSLPRFHINHAGTEICLNDHFSAAENPLSNKARVVKIPLANGFNFRTPDGVLLKYNDPSFIRMLAKLYEHEGTEFTFDASLNDFNLPTKAGLFKKEINVSSSFGNFKVIPLEAMMGEADSKLSLLISPATLAPLSNIISDALGTYNGWAIPGGSAPPYLTIAQAFVDRDLKDVLQTSPACG
ncbi:MAG: hypothetical protein Q8M03_02620 [Legionella sp.]|nr:hypothetical protein [Legionella sp.]